MLVLRSLVGGTVLTLVVSLPRLVSTVVLDIVANVLLIFTVEYFLFGLSSVRVPLDI